MNLLQTIILYFCRTYPYPDELSKARLTKMVYLADWQAAQRTGRQLSSINWVFNHYGPYVEDVTEAAMRTIGLQVLQEMNIYGTPRVTIRATEEAPNIEPPPQVRDILNNIIEETSPLTFNSFIQYVYETFPIRTADRYEVLNLEYLATQENPYRNF